MELSFPQILSHNVNDPVALAKSLTQPPQRSLEISCRPLVSFRPHMKTARIV